MSISNKDLTQQDKEKLFLPSKNIIVILKEKEKELREKYPEKIIQSVINENYIGRNYQTFLDNKMYKPFLTREEFKQEFQEYTDLITHLKHLVLEELFKVKSQNTQNIKKKKCIFYEFNKKTMVWDNIHLLQNEALNIILQWISFSLKKGYVYNFFNKQTIQVFSSSLPPLEKLNTFALLIKSAYKDVENKKDFILPIHSTIKSIINNAKEDIQDTSLFLTEKTNQLFDLTKDGKTKTLSKTIFLKSDKKLIQDLASNATFEAFRVEKIVGVIPTDRRKRNNYIYMIILDRPINPYERSQYEQRLQNQDINVTVLQNRESIDLAYTGKHRFVINTLKHKKNKKVFSVDIDVEYCDSFSDLLKILQVESAKQLLLNKISLPSEEIKIPEDTSILEHKKFITKHKNTAYLTYTKKAYTFRKLGIKDESMFDEVVKDLSKKTNIKFKKLKSVLLILIGVQLAGVGVAGFNRLPLGSKLNKIISNNNLSPLLSEALRQLTKINRKELVKLKIVLSNLGIFEVFNYSTSKTEKYQLKNKDSYYSTNKNPHSITTGSQLSTLFTLNFKTLKNLFLQKINQVKSNLKNVNIDLIKSDFIKSDVLLKNDIENFAVKMFRRNFNIEINEVKQKKYKIDMMCCLLSVIKVFPKPPWKIDPIPIL